MLQLEVILRSNIDKQLLKNRHATTIDSGPQQNKTIPISGLPECLQTLRIVYPHHFLFNRFAQSAGLSLEESFGGWIQAR